MGHRAPHLRAPGGHHLHHLGTCPPDRPSFPAGIWSSTTSICPASVRAMQTCLHPSEPSPSPWARQRRSRSSPTSVISAWSFRATRRICRRPSPPHQRASKQRSSIFRWSEDDPHSRSSIAGSICPRPASLSTWTSPVWGEVASGKWICLPLEERPKGEDSEKSICPRATPGFPPFQTWGCLRQGAPVCLPPVARDYRPLAESGCRRPEALACQRPEALACQQPEALACQQPADPDYRRPEALVCPPRAGPACPPLVALACQPPEARVCRPRTDRVGRQRRRRAGRWPPAVVPTSSSCLSPARTPTPRSSAKPEAAPRSVR